LLLRRWEQSKAGLGQVVLLSGEAGIGISSLVETLRVQVRQEGLPRIAYRCSPYHTNSALYPVIEQVRRVCQIQPDDPPATKLDKLEQTLHAYPFPLADVVPLLAARYAALTLSPQQVKQQTQDTLIAWLLAEAERQPVLAVWEDLHWADPSTLELLGLLIEQAPTAAMLYLLTFRPEFTPSWPARSYMTPIALNRLERPQVEALITHVAGGKTLPAEVVQHIVSKTDGVPLYVEELTKMFLESSLLHAEAESYTPRGPLAAVPIPATLQDSLMARLDQLNRAKDIAQLGAVLGREFTYDMVQALAVVDESTVQDGLAQLVTAELLYQRRRPPRARYFFKHALIQDTAYASLLRSTRQQLHQQVAQLFEARFPETVETQPELLAHHYTEASLHEQAVDYWHKAGQKALERSAYSEAIQHLRKGLAPLSDLPETPPRLQQEFALQSALGPALTAIKGFSDPEVEYAYTRAQVVGRQIGDQRQLFSEGMSRIIEITGATVTSPKYSMMESRVKMTTGLILSGWENLYHRTSPRLMAQPRPARLPKR
jgi:predicted ATPase